MASPRHTFCALIADDLTGACDAAIPFTLRGASSIVYLTPDFKCASGHDVAAISTESRELDISAIDRRIRDAASRLAAFDPEIIFKKIDSTLRGNVGAEIAAALEAFDCEFAIVTPAFPQMGRTIRDGLLHIEGDAGWRPIDIAERLRTQGLGDCVHIASHAVAGAIERGHRFISVETLCDDDLKAIALETFRFGRRVLYAGSAGLAAAVAETFFDNPKQASFYEPTSLPCIFCVGSDHPVMIAQLAALACERSTQCFAAGSTQPPLLAACLQAGHHAILAISRTETHCGAIRDLLKPARKFAGAILISGGDTASVACKALGAEAIELEGEIVTGLPWGRLQGGLLEGLPIATKSGGFGASDALIKVADFFTCQTN
ncbi:MAG: four-carbon acid sugar kinase family protein [Bryobacteraceae bacterium]